MNVYVAGSIGHLADARAAMSIARDMGHEITFDWTGAEGEIRDEWGSSSEVLKRGRLLAETERDAVRAADVVILLVYAGKGLGSLIETGIAIEREIPLWVVGSRESVFWTLPTVHRLVDLDHLRETFRLYADV